MFSRSWSPDHTMIMWGDSAQIAEWSDHRWVEAGSPGLHSWIDSPISPIMEYFEAITLSMAPDRHHCGSATWHFCPHWCEFTDIHINNSDEHLQFTSEPETTILRPVCHNFQEWALDVPPARKKTQATTDKRPRNLTVPCWDCHIYIGLMWADAEVYQSHGVYLFNKSSSTICSILIHLKDKTPQKTMCSTIYHITCRERTSHWSASLITSKDLSASDVRKLASASGGYMPLWPHKFT